MKNSDFGSLNFLTTRFSRLRRMATTVREPSLETRDLQESSSWGRRAGGGDCGITIRNNSLLPAVDLWRGDDGLQLGVGGEEGEGELVVVQQLSDLVRNLPQPRPGRAVSHRYLGHQVRSSGYSNITDQPTYCLPSYQPIILQNNQPSRLTSQDALSLLL